MATFIAFVDFTEQGIRDFRDTTKRADKITETATKAGITIKDIYWTVGPHDGIIIIEASDEETASAFFLSIGAQGNVRTQTLRAFSRSEVEAIISKMP